MDIQDTMIDNLAFLVTSQRACIKALTDSVCELSASAGAAQGNGQHVVLDQAGGDRRALAERELAFYVELTQGLARLVGDEGAFSEATLVKIQTALEEHKLYVSLLRKVSVMLGYDGDVDKGFIDYLRNRPAPSTKPNAYDLPDGGKTNVLSEAFHMWKEHAQALETAK